MGVGGGGTFKRSALLRSWRRKRCSRQTDGRSEVRRNSGEWKEWRNACSDVTLTGLYARSGVTPSSSPPHNTIRASAGGRLTGRRIRASASVANAWRRRFVQRSLRADNQLERSSPILQWSQRQLSYTALHPAVQRLTCSCGALQLPGGWQSCGWGQSTHWRCMVPTNRRPLGSHLPSLNRMPGPPGRSGREL